MNCIYCDGPLEPDSRVPHWKFCRKCSPDRAALKDKDAKPSYKPDLIDRLPERRPM